MQVVSIVIVGKKNIILGQNRTVVHYDIVSSYSYFSFFFFFHLKQALIILDLHDVCSYDACFKD